jgi:hypothetical protein
VLGDELAKISAQAGVVLELTLDVVELVAVQGR